MLYVNYTTIKNENKKTRNNGYKLPQFDERNKCTDARSARGSSSWKDRVSTFHCVSPNERSYKPGQMQE